MQTLVGGAFDVNVGCTNGSPNSITVTVSINSSYECHAYWCNSNYTSASVNLTNGVASSVTTPTLATAYTGERWNALSLNYDGSNLTIQAIADGINFGYLGGDPNSSGPTASVFNSVVWDANYCVYLNEQGSCGQTGAYVYTPSTPQTVRFN